MNCIQNKNKITNIAGIIIINATNVKLIKFISMLIYLFIQFNNYEFTNLWIKERLFERARCKVLCLKLFQNINEQEVFKKYWPHERIDQREWSSCFLDSDQQCSSACFTACDLSPIDCSSHCLGQKTIGCLIGCKFSQDTMQFRSGQCPSSSNPSQLNNYENVHDQSISHSSQLHQDLDHYYGNSLELNSIKCIKQCLFNEDCENPLEHCCQIGCERKCIHPIYNESVPPLPMTLIPLQSGSDSNMLKLSWSNSYDQLVTPLNPIVFILQLRICICKTLDNEHISQWHTLIMTHEFGANLKAFEPGRIYQFRIAAVNVFGTRGFGPESEPYPKELLKPNPPTPPRNITDSMWRLYSTGKISVLLRWEPPAHTDLPLTEYFVTWVVDHGFVQPDGQSFEALTKFTQTIQGDHTECILHNLKPTTSYKVQIKALSYWHGYGTLESQPNTIFLSTQSIHPAFQIPIQSHISLNDRLILHENLVRKNNSGCDCDKNLKFLILKQIYYENSQLLAIFHINLTFKPDDVVTIEWYPQVCLDTNGPPPNSAGQLKKINLKDSLITLHNLHFNCRYGVRIRIVHNLISNQIYSNIYNLEKSNIYKKTNVNNQNLHTCFCTPSCHNLEVIKGKLPDNCPSSVQWPLSPPNHLKVTYLGEMNYLISWEQVNYSERKIRTTEMEENEINWKLIGNFTKYRIIWAPRMQEPVNESMYNDEIGFSPIMDVQQSDVRIVDKNQTSIPLKDLKPNTFYIVRIQTLILSKKGVEKESDAANLYFITLEQNNNITQSNSQLNNDITIHSSSRSSSSGISSFIGILFIFTILLN